MDDNVCTMVQWVLNIRRQKGIINNHHDAMLMSDIGNRLNINKRECRIRRSLDPNQLCILLNHSASIDFNCTSKGNTDAVGRSNLGEISMSATIDIRDGNDMRASCEAL